MLGPKHSITLQGQLQIMLWWENIDLDSFLERNLSVYVGYIQLNQDGTFFMSVRDLMGIGIHEEISLVTLSCSWN